MSIDCHYFTVLLTYFEKNQIKFVPCFRHFQFHFHSKPTKCCLIFTPYIGVVCHYIIQLHYTQYIYTQYRGHLDPIQGTFGPGREKPSIIVTFLKQRVSVNKWLKQNYCLSSSSGQIWSLESLELCADLLRSDQGVERTPSKHIGLTF